MPLESSLLAVCPGVSSADGGNLGVVGRISSQRLPVMFFKIMWGGQHVVVA